MKIWPFMQATLISLTTIFASKGISQPDNINRGTYRMGASNDGNQHDKDDILDVALEIALSAEAGLVGHLTHLDYSNHLGDNDATQNKEMDISALGAAQRWGVSKTVLFNCQSNLQGAIDNIAKEINRSTPTDPFLYNVTGPMEVAYRGIMASKPEKRKYAFAISHSEWNDRHADTDEMTHTWEDIVKTGITTIHIKNQDSNGLMKADRKFWDWLNTSNNENWKWLWTRSLFKPKDFDASGTGTMWYIITGMKDQDGDGAKFKAIFEGDYEKLNNSTSLKSRVINNPKPYYVYSDGHQVVRGKIVQGNMGIYNLKGESLPFNFVNNTGILLHP